MKKYLPYIVIIIIGLVISIFSYTQLGAVMDEKTKTISITVPVSDIPAYKEILPSDLTTKEVLANEVSKDVVTDPQFVIGKHANSTLYASWAINKKLIEESGQFEDKHLIAIKIDYARSANAKAGDIVDVYYVKPSAGDVAFISDWAKKVASNVIVVSIEGIKTKGDSNNGLGTAILAVDKNITHKLVPGATKENDRYVLAIKQNISEDEPDEEEKEGD